MQNQKIRQMTTAALLCALAIVIPMFSPVKIIIEPASFTLASHVAIMVAMFISPKMGASVNVGATLGFLLGGFPPVVVARAASQLIFVVIGGYLISKHPEYLEKRNKMLIFMVVIGLIHAGGEILAVLPFYISSNPSGWLNNLFILVGVGTLIHSCVDFMLAKAVWVVLEKRIKKPAYQTNPAQV